MPPMSETHWKLSHVHAGAFNATRDPGKRRSARLASVAAGLMLLSSLTGCAPSEKYGEAEPRAVTTKEAERLSLVRMNSYDQHMADFTMSMSSEGKKLWLEGRVDFREHIGYANLLTDGNPETFALLQWNFATVAATEAQSQELPVQPPEQAPWQPRQLEPSSSTFDTGLAVVLNLAADRPENPVLLQQNGAQWHGKAEVGDVEVDVFSGPGEDNDVSDNLLYFVDDQAQLRKVVADLPRSREDATITLADTDIDSIKTPLTE